MIPGYTDRQHRVNPIYRKFADQIADDAARSASASSHSNAFDWLQGEWLWQEEPVRFETTPYGIARQTSVPYLIHNAPSGMWILALSEPTAFGMLVGLPPKNGEAQFSGDITIDGQSVRLRQTWRRRENSVEIRNERLEAGQWKRWDLTLLERVTPAN